MNSLRIVLRLNALSCLLFGLAFVIWPEPIAGLLGGTPAGLLCTVGALLLINGAHLVIGFLRTNLRAAEVLYFSVGDILWFLATLGLVGADVLVTALAGQIAAMLLASVVLAMGLAQIWLLAEVERSGVPTAAADGPHDPDLLPLRYSRLDAIGASWTAMKAWIKLWLLALNGVFLAALAFWPDPGARLALAAYVASGPLLAAIMIRQRGLTRLLGVAHLLPWLPLVGYLALRLTGAAGDPPSPSLRAYLLILAVMSVVCLILDAQDVWRWLRGERFRLGSARAAEAGSSHRAP